MELEGLYCSCWTLVNCLLTCVVFIWNFLESIASRRHQYQVCTLIFIIMASFKLCTLNVRGMKDHQKCHKIVNWLQVFAYDIVFLQETYLSTDDFEYFKDLWEGPVYLSAAPSSHSSGVAIAISKHLRVSVSQIRYDRSGRCISILCSFENSSPIRLCNLYAPCIPKDRVFFLDSLYTYTNGNNPCIVAGDFNCIMSNADRSGASSYSKSFVGRVELQDYINVHNLVDAWSRNSATGNGHTWAHPGNLGLSSRLDRVYVHNTMNFDEVDCIKFPFSDHDAVQLKVHTLDRCNIRRGYWKFNTSFLKHNEYTDDFICHYNAWRTLKPGFTNIVDWWEHVKLRIKELSVIYGVRKARERRRKLEEIQTRCLTGDIDTINIILAERMRGAYIRSREKVLGEGEKPSAFFYNKERRAEGAKVIEQVKDKGGNVVTGEGIGNIFHEFYSELYTEEEDIDVDVQNMFLNSISTKAYRS